MIYRPHFTYIKAETPEQTQAREAAANEEWRRRVIFHPIVQVHITPEPVVRPPIRIIRLVNPPMKREQTEPREFRIVRIQDNESTLKREKTQVRYRRPISLFVSTNDNGEPTFTVPRHIFIPSESRNTNHDEEERKYTVYSTRPPQMVRIDRNLYQADGTTPVQTYNNDIPPPQLIRLDRGLHQADGTTPPPQQQTNNTSPSSSQSRQNPIVANAATPQKSGSSNPLGAIGSFFGGIANAVTSAGSTIVNDVTGAAKSVGNAVSGVLSTANNAIQNAYNSAFGNQTQQEKQQLQNQLNQLKQQGQQELNQISQEKQQVQSQLQQVQQQAQQELNQINQEKQQVQSQLKQVQLQAQQELTQINAEKEQVQSQLQQVQQQAQQELTQINQNEQQLQNALQQIQQYQAQAEQMLQQNPNNPQLQNYLQQLQQAQQQVEQGLIQLQQEQQQIQSQLQQAQLQGQQELMLLNQAQQQVLTQLSLAKQQGQQELMQLNQAQQQIQSQLQQVEQQGQQELAQLNQAQQQIQSQLQQAQQQIQQEMSQLNKQGQGGNPIQQFFNDVADVSALVGYYATEGLGGVGEELAHVVQGKGLENFSQAVSQFNAIGGQKIARAVGDVTEVALPAIVTAVVAPELLPAELIGEAASVGIGEVVSKVTTGKWQSLPQVLQEANEGGVLGVIGGAAGSALEGGLVKLGTYVGGKVGDFLAGAGGRALAGAAVNEALTAPFTRNPEQLLLAGVLGAAGGAAGELVSKVPWLEQSEAVRNAIDTSEAGAKLGNELVNEGIEKGVLTPDEINGKTTTEIGGLLRQKYSTISNDIIKSLDKDTVQNLKEEGIITDNQVLNPDKFIKAVKDKVPDDQLQLLKNTAKLVEKYNEGISKLVGGYKLRIGNRTLLYRLKLGDETETGLGSAGKSEIFNDIRTINDIEKNVAGIYNNPSDVRDTAIGLKGTPKEADFVQKLYNAAKSAKSPLSDLKPVDNVELSFRDFSTDQSKILSQTIKDYLENEVGKRNVIIYGSNSVKQYLEDIARRLGGTLDTDSDPKAFLIKRGDEVIWKWRKPGDVDAFIRTDNPNDLDKIAQDLADRMNQALGINRFEAEGHLVIDKVTGDHIVDLHMENESSDYFNLYANNSTGADLGIQRPTPNYADVGVAKVSQIALDKANAVGGLREVSLNDLLNEINAGTKIDNPDHVVYLAKQILQGKDPETIKDVLTYFLGEIKDDELRDYLTEKFSQEFNIPESDLVGRPFLTSSPKLRDDIENILNEKYRYLAPASYRFKDAQDFLTLLKLAADLKDDNDLRALYEQLRDEFEERGIIPKDWEPEEIDWNTIQNAQRLLNSLLSAGSMSSIKIFPFFPISLGGSSSSTSSTKSLPSVMSPNSISSISSVSSPSSTIISLSSPSIPQITWISPLSNIPIINPPSVEYPPSSNEYPPPSISPPPSVSESIPSISPSPSVSPPSISPSLSISPSISPPSPSPSESLSVYIQSQSPPPSVFSASSIIEGGSSIPMGPPPMVPSVMPGGFGGGGNNVQKISGLAGEAIYL